MSSIAVSSILTIDVLYLMVSLPPQEAAILLTNGLSMQKLSHGFGTPFGCPTSGVLWFVHFYLFFRFRKHIAHVIEQTTNIIFQENMIITRHGMGYWRICLGVGAFSESRASYGGSRYGDLSIISMSFSQEWSQVHGFEKLFHIPLLNLWLMEMVKFNDLLGTGGDIGS